ncbi:hypothetical protein [Streptomyces sp. NPDC001978]|uniref:hypothetical protein n=1 Tax=Streptomyces sp. NPDC001978 TaxID=3364627 RepID=UPI00368B7A50
MRRSGSRVLGAPELLKVRGAMEQPFLRCLRDRATRHECADEALDELCVEPADGSGVSYFLQDEGELWQLREYAAQRSLYHLKEADPHAWPGFLSSEAALVHKKRC